MKAAIRTLLRRVGLEVRRAESRSAPRSPFRAQMRLLEGTESPVILDLGAHQGQTAKRYADAFPAARIHSFEPGDEAFRILGDAVGMRAQTSVHRLAVSDRCGTTTFHVSQRTATSSLLPRPAYARRYFPVDARMIREVEVQTTTIDRFCEEQQLAAIDILKMDIQGGELAALRGARGMLERHAIRLIFTEAMFVPHYEGAPLYHELATFLASFGYSLYDLYLTSYATNGQLRYGDAIFVSPQTRAEVIDRTPAEP